MFLRAFKDLDDLEKRFKTDVLAAFVRAQKILPSCRQEDPRQINPPDGRPLRPDLPCHGRQDRSVMLSLNAFFTFSKKYF